MPDSRCGFWLQVGPGGSLLRTQDNPDSLVPALAFTDQTMTTGGVFAARPKSVSQIPPDLGRIPPGNLSGNRFQKYVL